MNITKIKGILITVALLGALSIKANIAPKIIYNKKSATYSIVWDNTVAKITDLTPEIKINGRWVLASEFKTVKWEKREGNRLSEKNKYDHPIEMLYLVCTGHPDVEKFTLAFELMPERPYVVINSTITPSKKITLGGVKLFNSSNGNISLVGNSKDWIIFNESVAAPHTAAIMYPYQLRTPFANSGKFSKAHTGVWLSMLVNDSKNYTFSFASISSELWPNNFKWELPKENDNNNLKLSARSGSIEEKEQIVVVAGKTIVTDPFMICFRDDIRPTQALYETGVIMGENIRKGKPMNRPNPGWSSWHSYENNVTEKDILSITDYFKKNLHDYGWKNVQIDAGWWIKAGQYEVNDNFPRGIRYISNYVTDNGLDFGLHISPLRVNYHDPVIKQNKDWILQPYTKKNIKKNDEEMITTLETEYLDCTNPEVRSFLVGRYQQMVEGYRPNFMKWDHHYGALEEGDRKDSSMTALQGHNMAIRAIRSAIPEKMIITRSMDYLLGAIECFDAMRIGNDINRPGIKSNSEQWTNITFGKTLGTIEDKQVEKGLIRFARQVARNFYVHKNIAIADPDAFFVSPQYTIDEAKCHMTLQAIMGGLFFIGDRVESLPKERIDLLKNHNIMSVNMLGEHAVPLDLFSGVDIPAVWKLATKDKLIITIFNWSDTQKSKSYDFKKDLELNDDKYTLTELWTGENIKPQKGEISLTMNPHSVKIFSLKR